MRIGGPNLEDHYGEGTGDLAAAARRAGPFRVADVVGANIGTQAGGGGPQRYVPADARGLAVQPTCGVQSSTSELCRHVSTATAAHSADWPNVATLVLP